jgi:hypothetical protein
MTQNMTQKMFRLSFVVAAVFLAGASAMAAPSITHDASAVAHRIDLMQLARKVFIRGGCPYNLDKECDRLPDGRLVHCRCVS